MEAAVAKKTRKQKARDLLITLQSGPYCCNRKDGLIPRGDLMLWLETWITPLVKELVPELKNCEPVKFSEISLPHRRK